MSWATSAKAKQTHFLAKSALSGRNTTAIKNYERSTTSFMAKTAANSVNNAHNASGNKTATANNVKARTTNVKEALDHNVGVRNVKVTRVAGTPPAVNKVASKPKIKVDTKVPPGRASVSAKPSNSTAGNDKSAGRKPVTNTTPARNSSVSTNNAPVRVWNRNPAAPKSHTNKEIKSAEIVPNICENDNTAIQTNEAEILNHSLLVGDIKFLKPSKSIVMEIEKRRQEIKKKQMLKAQRKFAEHAEKQEEHITGLNEFLERSYVTKKQRSCKHTRVSLDEDKRLITSMDKLMNREIPKAESVTNIKERIKRKEQELLSLFDNVQNIRNSGNKN